MSQPSAVPPLPAARPPSYGRVSLGVVMSGREANLLGNIHGGEIVKLADSTAGAVAQRHSGGPAVTAALDETRSRRGAATDDRWGRPRVASRRLPRIRQRPEKGPPQPPLSARPAPM